MDEKTSKDHEAMMQPLRVRYLADLAKRQNLLEGYLSMARVGDWDTDAAKSLRELVHKLTGTGATYGFPEISETASLLEDLLDSEYPVPADLIAFDLDKLLDACAAAHDLGPGEKLEGADDGERAETSGEMPVVLVVDDDESVRAMLLSLMNWEATVHCARSADEAMAYLKEASCDLILLDDDMPGSTSGMMLLETLQGDEKLKSIPVIMITATDQPMAVMQGLIKGAVDYVTKPFDPQELGKKIKSRLRRRLTHILVVDDDPSVADLLARKFRAAGFSVDTAGDGTAAIESMKDNKPDLVVLDRMLPGLSGMTILMSMREIKSLENIPVVFLTARRRDADILAGFAQGVADYIVKPFNPDEVVVRCERLLRTKQAA